MPVLGLDARIFINSALDGSGTYTEIVPVRDVKINMSADTADVSRRGHIFKKLMPSLLNCEVEVEMLWEPLEPTFNQVRQAYFSRGSVYLRILDGPNSAGSSGIQGRFTVIDFSRNEPLADALTVTIKFAPHPATDPEFVVLT